MLFVLKIIIGIFVGLVFAPIVCATADYPSEFAGGSDPSPGLALPQTMPAPSSSGPDYPYAGIIFQGNNPSNYNNSWVAFCNSNPYLSNPTFIGDAELVVNSGVTIVNNSNSGPVFEMNGSNYTITNMGVIKSNWRAIVCSGGSGTLITNSGTVESVSGDNSAINFYNGASGTVTNTGTISSADGFAIYCDPTSNLTINQSGGNITANGNDGISQAIGIDGTVTLNFSGGTIATHNSSQAAFQVNGTLNFNFSGGSALFNTASNSLTSGSGTFNFAGNIDIGSNVGSNGRGILNIGNVNMNGTNAITSTVSTVTGGSVSINSSGSINILNAGANNTINFNSSGGISILTTGTNSTINFNSTGGLYNSGATASIGGGSTLYFNAGSSGNVVAGSVDSTSNGSLSFQFNGKGSLIGNVNTGSGAITLSFTSSGGVNGGATGGAGSSFSCSTTAAVGVPQVGGAVSFGDNSSITTSSASDSVSYNSLGSTASVGNNSTITINTGGISRNVSTGTGARVILQGSGGIGGSLNTSDTPNITFSSSGSVHGNVTTGNTATVTLQGTGGIGGSLSTGSGANITLSNSGSVTSNVTTGTGSSVALQSTGGIVGSLSTGSGSTITFSNSGRVSGSINGGNTGGTSTLAISGISYSQGSQSISNVSLSIGAGATFTSGSSGISGLGTISLAAKSGVIAGGILDIPSGSSLTASSAISFGQGSTVNITGGALTFPASTAGSINQGTIYILGSGTLGGSVPGDGSAGTNYSTLVIGTAGYPGTSFSSTGAIDVANITVQDNSTFTLGSTTANGTISVYHGSTLSMQTSFTNTSTDNINVNGNFYISGNSINSGAITINSATGGLGGGAGLMNFNVPPTGGFTFKDSGPITNNGTLTIPSDGTLYFFGNGTLVQNGTMNLNGTLQYDGTTNATPLTGTSNIVGGVSSEIDIGPSVATNAAFNIPISGVPTIKVITSGSQFTENQAVTGVSSLFSVADGAVATLNAGLTGGGNVTDGNGTSGALTISNSLLQMGTVTVNHGATLTVSSSSAATPANNTSGQINNSGTLIFSTTGTGTTSSSGSINNFNQMFVNGIFTNSGNLVNSGTITSNGTFTNTGSVSGNGTFSSTGILINSGTFTTPLSLTVNGTATNNGTMILTTTLNGTGTLTNGPNGILTLNNLNINSVPIINNGAISVLGTLNGSAAITNNTTGKVTMSNITNNVTFNNLGTISLSGTISGNAQINNNRVSPTVFGILNLNTVNTTNAITNNGVANVTGSLMANSINNASQGVMNFLSVNTSATINNSGNMVFSGTNINTGAITDNTIGTITINGASSLEVTGAGTIAGLGTILGAGNASTFIVNNDFFTQNKYLNVQNIIINSGAQMNLLSGGSITGFQNLDDEGALSIGNGAFLTINQGQNVYGAGSITNDGQITLNSANLILGGAFLNDSTGSFEINGTPNIVFNGASFINNGEIAATFNSNNSLPVIHVPNATPNLANGVLVIGYQHDYIAGGTYLFISGMGNAVIGGFDVPQQPNLGLFIKSFAIETSGGDVSVVVVRNGFGNVATDPVAKQIGFVLEEFGAQNPTGIMLELLNALEKVTTVAQLNADLLTLVPPEYIPLQSLCMVQDVITAVHGRLAEARLGLAFGDDNIDYNNGLWARPFIGGANQKQKGNLQAYKASTHGVALGFDNRIAPGITLGIGASIAKSKVNDATNNLSQTNISSYQGLMYGTIESKNYAYVDWAMAAGVNHYDGSRNIAFSGFNQTANATYSGQQFTIKAIASKPYMWKEFLQLTPMASAQYSFLRQLSYTENGAGPFDQIVEPNNINLLELGVGAQLAVPMQEGVVTCIPEIHAMALVDAKGGNVTTTTQFSIGGPILSQSVQQGRLIGQLGASLSIELTDRVHMIANYDYEFRRQFKSHEFYLDFRYTF